MSTRSSASRRAALLVALALALPRVARADEAAPARKLPEAKAVIARFVEAIGGKEAWRKHTSMKLVGELSIPAAGVKGSVEILAMAPDLTALKVEVPGLGSIREGYDGKVGWSTDPAMGPRIKQGKELAQAAFQADFYALLHDGGRFQSMETVATEELDGVPCHKIRLVTKNGDEMFEYFDVATGLLVATELEAETPMGSLRVVGKTDDYRESGGMKIPMRLRQTVGPMEQIMTLREVALDGLDRSAFEAPAEIRALTGAGGAAPAPAQPAPPSGG